MTVKRVGVEYIERRSAQAVERPSRINRRHGHEDPRLRRQSQHDRRAIALSSAGSVPSDDKSTLRPMPFGSVTCIADGTKSAVRTTRGRRACNTSSRAVPAGFSRTGFRLTGLWRCPRHTGQAAGWKLRMNSRGDFIRRDLCGWTSL